MASDPRFQALLPTGVPPEVVSALERLVSEGTDAELTRINPLGFAERHGFDEQAVIGALLQCARLGLYDLTWSVHCPSCSGTLDAYGSPKNLRATAYYCTLCDRHCDATLDSIVEATFTVNQRLRRVAAHAPETMSPEDYLSQLHFSTRLPLQHLKESFFADYCFGLRAIPPAGRTVLELDFEPGMIAVFEPVTHATAVFLVGDDPAPPGFEATVSFTGDSTRMTPQTIGRGKVKVALENRSGVRVLPIVHALADELHDLFQARQPFLSAKRLFTHPTFRELFRTSALDIDQKLRVESLTVLFTDLKGSTELYERVGDLAAFDLVKRHFAVLEHAVRAHQGSVVKTIGDAVMATFPSPDRGLAAALEMRESLATFNKTRQHEDLLIKIGLHDGPCLAVMLNERLDYFGQTVNTAARVQGAAEAQSILLTQAVLREGAVRRIVEERGLRPTERHAHLKGIKGDVTLYELAV